MDQPLDTEFGRWKMKGLLLRRLAMSSMLFMVIAGRATAVTDPVRAEAAKPAQPKAASARICRWVQRGHPPKRFVCKAKKQADTRGD